MTYINMTTKWTPMPASGPDYELFLTQTSWDLLTPEGEPDRRCFVETSPAGQSIIYIDLTAVGGSIWRAIIKPGELILPIQPGDVEMFQCLDAI
jgi:hypothetical protein